jgi:flagellar motility protein MotE (MotC chaperone)
MAKPGVVLKRPVGSDGPFGEHAELPKNLGEGWTEEASPQAISQGEDVFCPAGQGGGPESSPSVRTGAPTRREREEAWEEAARQKERARRQEAVDKAQAERPDRGSPSRRPGETDCCRRLDKAEDEHAKRAAALRSQIEALEKKVQAEETNWDEEAKRLKAALRRARD